MSGMRHRGRTVQRARALYNAGWSLKQTAELVARELGVPEPSISTVYYWVNPDAHERRRQDQQRRHQQTTLSRAKFTVPGHARSPEWKFGRMRMLYEHGIDPATIAALMAIDFADYLSEWDVRDVLDRGRMPQCWRPDPVQSARAAA